MGQPVDLEEKFVLLEKILDDLSSAMNKPGALI